MFVLLPSRFGTPCDGSATLLDIRTEGEYRRGHLEGFRNIPLDSLRAHLAELDPESRLLSTARPGCAAILPAAFWRSTAFPARTCPAATAFTAPSPQSSWRRAPIPAAWALRSVKFVAKQGIYGILDTSQLVLDPLSGSSIPVTEYKFFYGDRVIFTAFCADGWVIEVHDYRKQNDRAPQNRTAAAKRRTAPGRLSAISCIRMISTIGIGTTLRISRKPRITITVTAAG